MLQQFDERNRDLVVNIDGRLSHRDEAGVSPFDSVVQGGDAVWEGLRLYGGRIFALEEHLDRLRRSAQALAFEQIPTDGVWAPHWYASVEASTGFGPYRGDAVPDLPGHLVALAEQCQPFYDELAERALRS